MSLLKIQLNLGNAAFAANPKVEAARILAGYVDRLGADGNFSATFRDTDNLVAGFARVEDEDPAA